MDLIILFSVPVTFKEQKDIGSQKTEARSLVKTLENFFRRVSFERRRKINDAGPHGGGDIDLPRRALPSV